MGFRFRPEACQKCGMVTGKLRQVPDADGKWLYLCPECRGIGIEKDVKLTRRNHLHKVYAKELRR